MSHMPPTDRSPLQKTKMPIYNFQDHYTRNHQKCHIKPIRSTLIRGAHPKRGSLYLYFGDQDTIRLDRGQSGIHNRQPDTRLPLAV